MQYKIPVQVENTDKIIGPFSLVQLIVLMAFGAVAYTLFTKLEPQFGSLAAGIPAGIIVMLGLLITLGKRHDMTFIPYVLASLRYNLNSKERYWQMGVDSFQPIDIGYVTTGETKKDNKVDIASKEDKMKDLYENLNKI